MRQAKRGLSHVCRIDRVFHRRSNFFAFRRFECREVFSEGVRDSDAGVGEGESVANAATSLSPGSSSPRPLDFLRRRVSLVLVLGLSLCTKWWEGFRAGKGSRAAD